MTARGNCVIVFLLVFILYTVRPSCVERIDVVEGDVYIVGVFPAVNSSITDKHNNIFPHILSKYINGTNKQNKIMRHNFNIGCVIFYHSKCTNYSNGLSLSNILLGPNSTQATINNTIAMFVSELKNSKEKDLIFDKNTNIPIFILKKDFSSPSYNMSSLLSIHLIFPRIFLEIDLFSDTLRHSNIDIINIISTNHFYDRIVAQLFVPMLMKNRKCFYFMKSNQIVNQNRSFIKDIVTTSHSYTFLFGDKIDKINDILRLGGVKTTFIGHRTWTDFLEKINITNITSPIIIVRPCKKTKPSSIALKISKLFQENQIMDLWDKELLRVFLNTIDFVTASLGFENKTIVNKTIFVNHEKLSETRALINQNLTSSILPKSLSLITINGNVSLEEPFYSLVEAKLTNELKTNSKESSCSKKLCKFNYKNVYRLKILGNGITSHEYSCEKCQRVDDQHLSCRRHYEHVSYYTSQAYILYTIMVLGVLTSATVCIIFFAYKDTPCVKASHQSMSLIQLFAHLLLFLAPAMFIGKPSQSLCTARPVTFGILFTFIMAMTVTKTQKLNLIFHSRLRVSKRQVQMSQKMEIALVLLMMLVQLCIAGLSYFMSPSRVLIIYKKELQSYVIKCNTDEEFIIQLIFGFLLAIMCMYQAFKARKLPENFNETKLIFYAMILCIISAIIGLLLRYFVIKKNMDQVLIDVLLLLSMNCIQLFFMYGHKCYIIIFYPQLNTPSAFKQNLQLHTLKGMVPDHVTMSHRDSTFSGITTISSPPNTRTIVFRADNMAFNK